MIDLEFAFDTVNKNFGKVIWERPIYPFKKPRVKFLDASYSFIDDLHNWFIENNIDYDFVKSSFKAATIRFKNQSDAILFKLTWMYQ